MGPLICKEKYVDDNINRNYIKGLLLYKHLSCMVK